MRSALVSPGAAFSARAAMEASLAPVANEGVRTFMRQLLALFGIDDLTLVASTRTEQEALTELGAKIDTASTIGHVVDLWQAAMDPLASAASEFVQNAIRDTFKAKLRARIAASSAPVDMMTALVDEATSRGLQTTQRPAAAERWAAFAEQYNRSFSTSAFNAEQLFALVDAGFTHKRWVTRQDNRVRDTHQSAQGQVVDIYAPFMVGGSPLLYPGDPDGPAAEVINCRCVTVGVKR